MAKNDTQTIRATMRADGPNGPDELMGQVYRPAAPSLVRPKKREDADHEDEALPRSRRRIPVRRGLIPASRVGRVGAAVAVVFAIGLLVWVAIGIRNFFRDDPRFRISSSASIQIMGNSQVTRPELLSVFGSDLGRNIFFIPLAARKAALEQLPWVEHATVMRLLPDQLRVAIVERTPVAFVRQANTIGLIDAHGVLLHLPPVAMTARHYSFPVITGISAKDPLPVRAGRMRLYQQFISELDSGGSKVSSQLSEVDLSDPEDVWALLPAEGADIQVHFGDSDFLARYRSYRQHLPEWRQQYPHLTSVDMRYENQVVLDVAQQSNAEATKHAGQNAAKPAQKPLKPVRAKG